MWTERFVEVRLLSAALEKRLVVRRLLDRGARLQASAARFLIDGGEEDAASVLLACELSLWKSGDTWHQGDELLEAVHVSLSGPRAA